MVGRILTQNIFRIHYKMRELVCILLCIVLIIYIPLVCVSRRSGTIFTCTTFFDFQKQDKWEPFCHAMDSILEHHSRHTLARIDRWLIVNEYAETPTCDWAERLRLRYPYMVMIQKNEHQKGQAASMNIILEEIRPYEYWIHWEDSWFPKRECLQRAFDVMDSTDITQLQMTQHTDAPNWLDKGEHRAECTPAVCRIYASDNMSPFLRQDVSTVWDTFDETIRYWPLYSLLPSINRASFYTFGYFSTDPALWPILFEWDFARRWYWRGGTKAVLPDGPVLRKKTHVSTYTK